MRRAGKSELEAFARRWLDAHPDPTDAAEPTVAVDEALEVLGVDLAVPGSERTVVAVVRDGELEHLEACSEIPEQLCDGFGRTCGTCPGFAAWRAKVRPPYEVGR